MVEAEHPLRRWRTSLPKPLNQSELGQMLGIGGTMVSQIENGHKGCSLDVAIKIAKLAGDAVPLESLLGRQGA